MVNQTKRPSKSSAEKTNLSKTLSLIIMEALDFLTAMMERQPDLKLHFELVPTTVGEVDSVEYYPLTDDHKKTVKEADFVLIQRLPDQCQPLEFYSDRDCCRTQDLPVAMADLLSAVIVHSECNKTISRLIIASLWTVCTI